jgi:hypothetical protein
MVFLPSCIIKHANSSKTTAVQAVDPADRLKNDDDDGKLQNEN